MNSLIIYIILFFVPFFAYGEGVDSAWLKISDKVRHLEKAEPNSSDLADAYMRAGKYKSRYGAINSAHQYYYKAITIYEKQERQEDKISNVYYLIAADYLQILDLQGLEKTIQQLGRLANQTPSAPALYHLYSMKGAYFYALLTNNRSEMKGLTDSSLLYFKKSIELTQKHQDSVDKKSIFAWNYYNVAFLYNAYFYPPRVDSVILYLKKMEQAKNEYEQYCIRKGVDASFSIQSMQVSILYLKACIEFYRKNYAEAEDKIFQCLALLGPLGEETGTLPDYQQSYTFLSDLYEKTDRPSLALKYTKMVNEIEKKIFDLNKSEIMNRLSLQYETEQKEFQIATLKSQNKLMNKNLIIMIFFVIFFFLSLILIFILFQYKKRHLNEKAYEAILDADLQKEQADLALEKIRLLEDEQSHLMSLAKENEEKAKEYQDRLNEIKQKISHKPSEIVIEKIANLIEESRLDKNIKGLYLGHLKNFDIAYFEDLQINAKEKLSVMDIKYMCCFAIEMNASDISLLFNVEPASVHTVHYRIRKKIGRNIL